MNISFTFYLNTSEEKREMKPFLISLRIYMFFAMGTLGCLAQSVSLFAGDLTGETHIMRRGERLSKVIWDKMLRHHLEDKYRLYGKDGLLAKTKAINPWMREVDDVVPGARVRLPKIRNRRKCIRIPASEGDAEDTRVETTPAIEAESVSETTSTLEAARTPMAVESPTSVRAQPPGQSKVESPTQIVVEPSLVGGEHYHFKHSSQAALEAALWEDSFHFEGSVSPTIHPANHEPLLRIRRPASIQPSPPQEDSEEIYHFEL